MRKGERGPHGETVGEGPASASAHNPHSDHVMPKWVSQLNLHPLFYSLARMMYSPNKWDELRIILSFV